VGIEDESKGGGRRGVNGGAHYPTVLSSVLDIHLQTESRMRCVGIEDERKGGGRRGVKGGAHYPTVLSSVLDIPSLTGSLGGECRPGGEGGEAQSVRSCVGTVLRA
jgi:hypothetical protein